MPSSPLLRGLGCVLLRNLIGLHLPLERGRGVSFSRNLIGLHLPLLRGVGVCSSQKPYRSSSPRLFLIINFSPKTRQQKTVNKICHTQWKGDKEGYTFLHVKIPMNRKQPESIIPGLTQQELAMLIGVSRSLVSHWQAGRRSLPEYARRTWWNYWTGTGLQVIKILKSHIRMTQTISRKLPVWKKNVKAAAPAAGGALKQELRLWKKPTAKAWRCCLPGSHAGRR